LNETDYRHRGAGARPQNMGKQYIASSVLLMDPHKPRHQGMEPPHIFGRPLNIWRVPTIYGGDFFTPQIWGVFQMCLTIPTSLGVLVMGGSPYMWGHIKRRN
jgi:hypothetical protein